MSDTPIKAIQGKITALCLLVISLCVLLFPQIAYAANPIQETINVEQVFHKTGGDTTVGGRFGYKITALSPGCPMPAASTFTIDGTGSAQIGPIQFTQPGTYEYQIEPDNRPAGAGYSFDTQAYVVTIHVTQAGNDLIADVIVQKADGEKAGKVLFTHAYGVAATDPSLMVDPPVKKTVSGTPRKDSIFTFSLTAENPKNPMPEGSKDGVKLMTIEGSGEKDFGTWSYTEVGTYFYTIAEVDMGEKDYAYDSVVYTITDTVTDVDGVLELNRVVTNNAGKPITSCAFINQYTGTDIGDTGGIGGAGGVYGPKTGDERSIGTFVITIVIASAIVGIAVVLLFKENKRREKSKEKDNEQ